MKKLLIALIGVIALSGCLDTANKSEQQATARQQEQYAVGQPVPAFDWSLERHLISELYKIRNERVSTHSVWRSNHGMIEGDCTSIGFGLPYDTSLTNPLQRVAGTQGATSVEQAEPNGIFASKNTAATWVMCLGVAGTVEPVYVETKVTAYPYPVKVDYDSNRVSKIGKSSTNIRLE